MNLWHATALAAIGWYLIAPPFANHHVDEKAPIAKWQILDSFDSVDKCRVAYNRDVNTSARMYRENPTTRELTFAQHAVEELCIANDDPRLKGN